MSNVIGVKFKTGGRVYFFDPVELEIHTGDGVIVETARGEEFGDVVSGPMEVEEEKIVAPLKPVLRVATEETGGCAGSLPPRNRKPMPSAWKRFRRTSWI